MKKYIVEFMQDNTFRSSLEIITHGCFKELDIPLADDLKLWPDIWEGLLFKIFMDCWDIFANNFEFFGSKDKLSFLDALGFNSLNLLSWLLGPLFYSVYALSYMILSILLSTDLYGSSFWWVLLTFELFEK